ncbi:4Fe-4S dicluster domain-containing protein [Georgenia thermotolerans]|uniref:4Fe-4S dicluster domain-containing protein n=1 Tax=Georgenia thermotolerans TaxID=527326 RepID=A0A7J5UJE8_9MICO|nr:4Fe-4S dicluster domain-containing protein [Georgenia thermotolerans]KAE8762509.1 4Fe-4S dicluster domain-containing protein [Georgenia thermotolerans]
MARHSLFGPIDPAKEAGYADPPARKGFFTDTSVCIGCKACEVACKEWNLVPDEGFDLLGMSYDNTGALGANTWRHVAFVEQPAGGRPRVDLGMPTVGPPGGQQTAAGPSVAGAGGEAGVTGAGPAEAGAAERPDFRWLMSSDVCKHCTHAACLDVCPTGSLLRTEFGTVVVQPDICNGCGYCVPACPYGVIERRKGPAGARNVGIAQKCTLCYDRLGAGMEPACAKACPTDSIQFGDLDELRERARARVADLHEDGVEEARLYGDDPLDGVGGAGAFFLLLDEPEVYGLPPDPVVTTRDLPHMFNRATTAAAALLVGAAVAFLGKR